MSLGKFKDFKDSSGESSVPGVDLFAHFRIARTPEGLLDSLGSGAMGITYRAFDTKLERPVALKIIHPTYVDEPEVRTRFAREAKAAARLQHPNIASVLYQGEEGSSCFYVMELVDGENLHNYIERVGPLSPVHALRIAHQIALALSVASKEGVLHRDLKPGNVMLVTYHEGRDPHAKVIDFGLAKLAQDSPASQLSTFGFVGTPEFASPEQCEEKPLDGRSDIYSLGATLWFMLAGAAPFNGSMLSIIRAHVESPPPFQMLPGAPQPLTALLGRLLAKDPEDRPANALEAAQEIDETLTVLSKEMRNFHPLVSSTAVTEVIAKSRERTKAKPAASRRKPGASKGLIWAGAILGLASVAMAGYLASQYLRTVETAPKESPAMPPGPADPQPPAVNASSNLEVIKGVLGWEYVRIPNTGVNCSTVEVRVRDFQKFVSETKYKADGNWQSPGFKQSPDDPVVNVSWNDAVKFCEWLTAAERKAGTITAAFHVRLPDRREWDRAAGVPAPGQHPVFSPEGGMHPSAASSAPGGGPRGPGNPGESRPPEGGPQTGPPGPGGPAPGTPLPYLWGFAWPPPKGEGNLADTTSVAAGATKEGITGYDDGFAYAAPVGSLKKNRFGLFDFAGNVSEIAVDVVPGQQFRGWERGGAWSTYQPEDLRHHAATEIAFKSTSNTRGIRCVVAEVIPTTFYP